MRGSWVLLLAVCLSAVPLTYAQTPASAGTLQGDAERGKTLYLAYSCYACHGYSGETGTGARLNPPRFNEAGFIAYVRSPPIRDSAGAGNSMPPYAGDAVSDQDLADVYTYVSSLPSRSPPIERIPLLRE